MRILTIAAIVAGQFAAAATPAHAADLAAGEPARVGAFGGLRISVPLDGAHRERPVRAGLTLAPTTIGRTAGGEVRTRVGEGLALDFAGRRPVTVSLAGTRLDRLGAAQDADDEDGGGLPTWAWVAGGVTLTLGAGWLVFAHLMNESSE
jgi:hypothetical protein